MGRRDDRQNNRHSQIPDNLPGKGLADKGGQRGKKDNRQITAYGDPSRNLHIRGHERDTNKGASLTDQPTHQADGTGNDHRPETAERKRRHNRLFAILSGRHKNKNGGDQGHKGENKQQQSVRGIAGSDTTGQCGQKNRYTHPASQPFRDKMEFLMGQPAGNTGDQPLNNGQTGDIAHGEW